MKSLFILGCGRSGTSMVAGLFAKSGYFMGEQLHEATTSNPRGYFEDLEVNLINEEILARYTPAPLSYRGVGYAMDAPRRLHRWLARIPVGWKIEASAAEIDRAAALVARQPFCFKDPRFCYTLPIWRQVAPNARSVCVFRNPAEVVDSILTECARQPYLHDFAISVNQAIEVWTLMYRHVLDCHKVTGDWLFLFYDDLLAGKDLDQIESFADVSIDRSFPSDALKRSRVSVKLPAVVERVFDELLSEARR